jgi:tripeptide aminopeptidase
VSSLIDPQGQLRPSVRPRASADERAYLQDLFTELCLIESPSGSERGCAQKVREELIALGLQVKEDQAGELARSDSGNLLSCLRAAQDSDRGSVLLCAHLDTVPLQGRIEPVLIDGGFQNAEQGILGADNKAAIAVILTVARHLHRRGAPLNLEMLFTVCEEQGLAGARAFDVSQLQSEFGFVFDHASPIGEVIVASPTHFRVEIRFHGAAAHAGIRPQDGRSAILAAARTIASMPHGRLNEQTTVNVGTISGGSAMNVVAEHCVLVAEVRSHSERVAEATVRELVDHAHDAANLTECECDVDVKLQRMFAGYDTHASEPAVLACEAALRSCGYEPQRVCSGGASDANALRAQGFMTVNVANGTERNHEPDERVSIAALEGMLDVALALVQEISTLDGRAAGEAP